ncbi:MAG: flagellar hook-length control protein FliK, partial [Synergistaceae bacterium]|nr:flagellar hook-length control protein FliK [Synergistaceae bacterium]
LVNVVRFIRADGVQKANVVIDPPALGRISVELTSSSSGVEASIKVSTEQIRQLVQDQLTQLRMNLSEQGVQVAEFTVDVQQDSQNGGGNSQNENQQDEQRNFIGGLEEEDDTEDFRIDLEDGLLYWVA